jgi:hypothetical protein
MLELLTDIETVQRIDYTFPSNAASGFQGCYVVPTSTVGSVALTQGSVGNALPIWTEGGNRTTETAGSWSPDVSETSKITVINGAYRARTNKYTEEAGAGGTLSLGDPLKTWSGGELAKATLGTDYIVGYVQRLGYSYTFGTGQTATVIDFITN